MLQNLINIHNEDRLRVNEKATVGPQGERQAEMTEKQQLLFALMTAEYFNLIPGK